MKNLRLKFLPGQQKVFIQNVYQKSGLSTMQLAKMASIHPRSFIDWRREKLTITVEAAELFCREFNLELPEKKEDMIERWRKAKKAASSVGGASRFAKHGSPATDEGRRKGGIKTIANLRKDGRVPKLKTYDLPVSRSNELAELVGIMLGDGGMTPGQCAVTPNGEADREYIGYVSWLGNFLFGEYPKVSKHKKDKTVILYYNGSSLVRYLLKIGLKVGNKVRQQVGVPEWVLFDPDYRIACLRGLMDTDGGVFLHRYSVNRKIYAYPKICFSNRSIPLLQFVMGTLAELEFTPKIIDKVANKKVWLYNTREVDRYLHIVGTHNPRLLKYQ